MLEEWLLGAGEEGGGWGGVAQGMAGSQKTLCAEFVLGNLPGKQKVLFPSSVFFSLPERSLLGRSACMLETSQTPRQNGSRLGLTVGSRQKILEFLNKSEGLQLVSNCKQEAKELSSP